MNEDVFPIENGGLLQLVVLVFRGVLHGSIQTGLVRMDWSNPHQFEGSRNVIFMGAIFMGI